MQDDVAVILIMMAIEGALFVALGVPLMLGKVKPNRWYGFRTPATLENPDVWYPVNAYSGKWLVGVGLAMILASVLLYAWPELTEGQAVVTMVSVIMGGIALMVVFSFRKLAQIKSDMRG